MSKILVVDPAPVERKRIRNILEAAGHTVVEASSQTEAIWVLEGAAMGIVNLVVTELMLPDSHTGLQFVHWLRQQHHLRAVPVLVVTPQPSREQVIELVQGGVATIIAKPFGTDLLLRRVTETLAGLELLRQGEGNNLTWQIVDYIRRELKRAERSQSPFSLIICRVKNAGEGQLVQTLMTGLAPLMRESDVVARLDRDHAVVLLPDTDAVGAWAVEDRIWQMVRQLAEGQEGRLPIHLEVTTGAATFPVEAVDPALLIGLARERAARRTA